MTDTILRLGQNLANIEAEATEWLVPNVLAKGMPTCLVGDGGTGKTSLMGRWTGDISLGRPLVPGGKAVPAGHVIFASVEDDPARVLKPRFMANGCDENNITILREVPFSDGRKRRLQLPGDTKIILDAIRESSTTLLVLDPVFSLLDDKHDAYKSPQVYRAMGDLLDGCQELGCSLVYALHVNKNRQAGAGLRHEGAMAWKNMARVMMLVAKDPEDPTDKHSVLVQVKSNMGQSAAWRLRVDAIPFRDLGIKDEDGDNTAGKLEWNGTSMLTADELSSGGGGSREERSERNDAAQLWDVLEAEGVNTWDRIWPRAKEYGFSEKAFKDAGRAKGFDPKREGYGDGSKVYWRRRPPVTGITFTPNGSNGHHPEEFAPEEPGFPFGRTPN